MRKSVAIFVAMFVLLTYTAAASGYMVNPFYAIDSANEYEKVKEYLSDGSSDMYFQWGRLARNKEGKVQFTNQVFFPISQYDIRTEYGVPLKAGSEAPTEYVVKPGESLTLIGEKFGIPYKLLGEYNEITDINKIGAGQKLLIPSKEYDTTNKLDFKQRFPNNKALLSVFFEASDDADKKNSVVEFLNMNENEWKEWVINPIMVMVNSMKFDGVVLDFEAFRDTISNPNYVQEKRTGLKKKYNLFLRLLKNTLGAKILEVIVHPNNFSGCYDGYDYPEIGMIADYTILMAYSFQNVQKYNSRDDVPAELYGKIKSIDSSVFNQPYIQPYDKVHSAVEKLLTSGIAPRRVLLGLELAPLKWVEYTRTIQQTTYRYYEMHQVGMETVDTVNAKEAYVSTAAVSVKKIKKEEIPESEKSALSRSGAEIESIQYHYESPQSLESKYYRIVNEYHLAGITLWRLGFGSDRTWKGLENRFVPARLPTPTPSLLPTPTPSLIPTPENSFTPGLGTAAANVTPSPSGTKSIKMVFKIGSPYMEINGTRIEVDPGRGTVPVIKDNRTLVPVKSVVDAIGGSIRWNGEKSLVTIEYENTHIELTIGSRKMLINGTAMENDVAAMTINGRTYLPLSFIMITLGFKVQWVGSTQTIIIENQ